MLGCDDPSWYGEGHHSLGWLPKRWLLSGEIFFKSCLRRTVYTESKTTVVDKTATTTARETCTAPTSVPAAVVNLSFELERYASELELCIPALIPCDQGRGGHDPHVGQFGGGPG